MSEKIIQLGQNPRLKPQLVWEKLSRGLMPRAMATVWLRMSVKLNENLW